MVIFQALTAAWLLASRAVLAQETGNHPDWPRWCGKVYEAGYPAFEPGGATVEPSRVAGAPLLHVQFEPRWSLYLDSETEGHFVVKAESSEWFGQSWSNSSSNQLAFSIKLAENDDILVQSSIDAGSTNIFSFDLSRLKASKDPIEVVLYGAPIGDDPSRTATTSLYYLPEKKNGSVTRLDNLNGGMFFRNKASGNRFVPLLPYGFYSSYDGFLANNGTSHLEQYAGYGLNAMTPLTLYRDDMSVFAFFDRINMKFQYDLRDGYQNLTYVEQKIVAARDAEAIYSYWTADEPDGHQDPFNGTVLAHDLIRKLDPYHVVAVVLNCQDYYFKEYTLGADIIMEDVYPIGINSTFSKWNTTCNTTLGDCGCDNCKGNVQDVPNRLDDLAKYERWTGLWPKTKIHNPQSFYGEGYWSRYPTPEEEYVMALLAFNHGAQGIISWVYPTTDLLASAHGNLSKVVTVSPVVDFLVGGDRPHPINANISGTAVVDAAYWAVGKQALVSVVNGGYVDINSPIQIPVAKAKAISSNPWGNISWTLENNHLSVSTLPALGTSLIILDLL